MPVSPTTGEVNGVSVYAMTGKYYWVINSFSKRCENVVMGEKLKSPIFEVAGPKIYTDWQLKLYPRGMDEKSKENLSIYLFNVSDKTCKAVGNLKVLNAKHDVIKTWSTYEQKFDAKCGWGNSQLLKLDFVMNPENGVLRNDKLIILCEVTVKSDEENKIFQAKERKIMPLVKSIDMVVLENWTNQEMNAETFDDEETEKTEEKTDLETENADDAKEIDNSRPNMVTEIAAN